MTNVLSQEAAARIWTAHREIEAGKKLLAEVQKALTDSRVPTPIDPRDRRHFTLGRGTIDRWESIADLSPLLAVAVIEAHIAEKKRELMEASIAARIELESEAND